MEKARLQEKYVSTIRPELQKKLGLKNIMEVPKVEKIVLNIGTGIQADKRLEEAEKVLGQITGQRPVRTRARKSIAGFKLREGMSIGTKVTLRGKVMYEFLDRLISVALPKVRDFQGVTTKLDRRGNYNLGIKEVIIFPEIGFDMLDKPMGLNITIDMSAKTDEIGRALLEAFGMPFKKPAQ